MPTSGAPDRCSPVRLRLEAARRAGCEVLALDPETGFLHELRRDGRSRVLMGAVSPLNDAAAARLANDKFHTTTALAAAGLRVPEGVRCLRPGRFEGFEAHTGRGPAHELARRCGYPLVVKPNGGSRGRGVTLVDDPAQLDAAIDAIWADDYLALVQRPVLGIDLRIDLLDERCIFAYLRHPLTLVGDGHRSLHALLMAADPRFSSEWCQTLLPQDPQWQRQVVAQGLSLDSILAPERSLRFDTVILNLNRLCRGEVVQPLPSPWLEFACRVAHRMGLRHLGIDLKIESLAQDPAQAVILEVNASPSLGNMAMTGHYEEVVAIEQQIVEAILASAPPETVARASA